ncbi:MULTISPECIES: MarR family winged helix-turn-helix transcriptional regulator [Streptomyces]|uniref:MarR family transcriptional regulator n=1 Tax=Streptomyces canarius TaxID=285453 RepID=A0ABQ3CND3_9ACTN|nr:MarR family transcriptional regulator [Streptomyces canarius]GHA16430.1 MarR family transcriptional regulator [Streptomyces canarius]
MTRLGGIEDDGAGAGDGVVAAALGMDDAVELLVALWSSAAQDVDLRLSPHQLRALRALEAAPDLNLTALAERLGIGLPTASRLCDRLEAAGLLERSPRSHDRREVRLELTAHARRVLADVARRRTRALATALRHMAPDDRAALRQGLRALRAVLDGGAPVRGAEAE